MTTHSTRVRIAISLLAAGGLAVAALATAPVTSAATNSAQYEQAQVAEVASKLSKAEKVGEGHMHLNLPLVQLHCAPLNKRRGL